MSSLPTPTIPVDLLAFSLPHRTDLMSKLLLIDKTVMNMVVEALVNESARDEYTPWPTEWPNRRVSDVLYMPKEPNTDRHPPILIEVQRTVDNDFILRLTSYALSIIQQYGTPPIILTFATATMKYEVVKRTKRNKQLSFLLQYPCHPWASACYFVDEKQVESMTPPLDPFPCIAAFLTGQHTSLTRSPYRNDPTMKLLYTIATRLFHDQIIQHDEAATDLVDLCQNTINDIQQAIDTFQDDSTAQASRILQNTIDQLAVYKNKYESVEVESSSSSSLPSPSSSSSAPTAPPAPPAANADANADANANACWGYVDQRVNDCQGHPIPWESIFDDGKKKGLFSYKNWRVLKSSYYRWSKQSA